MPFYFSNLILQFALIKLFINDPPSHFLKRWPATFCIRLQIHFKRFEPSKEYFQNV